jgi:CubicO group peptidase (beta-lactamase class C family)
MPTRRPTRRTALLALGAIPAVANFASAQPVAFNHHEHEIPSRGKVGPGLEPLDTAVIEIMERHGIPGAALTITKDGRLLLAKGYGWADMSTGTVVEPDMLFGLASLTKAITAVATLKLVEQGKLGLDDKVFDHLKHIKLPRNAKPDARLAEITVRQCLNHSGGWDRAKSGDPANWEPQICRAMRVAPPLSSAQFLSFILSVPLDFAPGTNAQYSNVGYVILGELIAKVSGQSYEKYATETVLKPMGIKAARLNPRDGKYPTRTAHRHLAGTLVPLPGMRLPMIDSAGGWLASAVDMARFLTNLDGSRGEPVLGEKARAWMVEAPPAPLKPRENGSYYGLGWDTVLTEDKSVGYFKDGSYQGIRTYMKRLPIGVNWALLFNASMELDGVDSQLAASAIREVQKRIESLEKHPEVDLFKDFA